MHREHPTAEARTDGGRPDPRARAGADVLLPAVQRAPAAYAGRLPGLGLCPGHPAHREHDPGRGRLLRNVWTGQDDYVHEIGGERAERDFSTALNVLASIWERGIDQAVVNNRQIWKVKDLPLLTRTGVLPILEAAEQVHDAYDQGAPIR